MYIWNMCTKDLRKKIVPSWKTLEEWFRQQRYLLGEARHYPRNFHNRNFFLQKTRLKSNMNTTTSPDGEVSIFKGRSNMTFISLTDTDSFIRHVRRGSRKVSKEALGRQKEGGGGLFTWSDLGAMTFDLDISQFHFYTLSSLQKSETLIDHKWARLHVVVPGTKGGGVKVKIWHAYSGYMSLCCSFFFTFLSLFAFFINFFFNSKEGERPLHHFPA